MAVDSKEHGLIRALLAARVAHEVRSLPVGDVLCTYENGEGCPWILERKRADDLAASIKDGRWREQSARLFETGHKVLFAVEGTLRGLGMYEPMLGAVVNANLRSSCLFRTQDVEETACLIAHLLRKLQTPPAPIVTGGLRPHKSRRKRCAQADAVFVLQLMCIPSISEKIAEALAGHFGDIESLQEHLRGDVKAFPCIRISAKASLGKARILTLRKHLLRQGQDTRPSA